MKIRRRIVLINALGAADGAFSMQPRNCAVVRLMATLKILKAVGFPKELLSGNWICTPGEEKSKLAFQAPDKLQFAINWA